MMRNAVKIVTGVAIALTLFVAMVFVEAGIRSHYGGLMTIDGLPISNVSVNGLWISDLLWTGKAWRLEIKTDEELELSLNEKGYIIPKSSHEIYSNRDHTNTGKFGAQEFHGYPKKVEVRQFSRKP